MLDAFALRALLCDIESEADVQLLVRELSTRLQQCGLGSVDYTPAWICKLPYPGAPQSEAEQQQVLARDQQTFAVLSKMDLSFLSNSVGLRLEVLQDV